MTFPRPVQRADETQLVNPFALNQAILIGLVEQRPQTKALVHRMEKALREPFGIFPEFDFLVLDDLATNGNRTMLVHRLNSLAEASKVQAFENVMLVFVGHAQSEPELQLLFSERGLQSKAQADSRDWLDWDTFTQWLAPIQTKNLMLAVDTPESEVLFSRDVLGVLQSWDEQEPGQKWLVAPRCNGEARWAHVESTFFLEAMVEALEGWSARTDRGVVTADTLFSFLLKRVPELSHRKSGKRTEPFRLRWPERPRSTFAITQPSRRAELDDHLKDALLQGRCLLWAGEQLSERCIPSGFPPRSQWEGLQRGVWLEYADFQREPGPLSQRLAALKVHVLDSGVDSSLEQACDQHDFVRWVPSPASVPPQPDKPILARLSGTQGTPDYVYEWEDLEPRFHRVKEWLRQSDWCDTLLLLGFPWDEPIARQWLTQLMSFVPRCWMVFPYGEEHDRVPWLRQLGVRLLFLSDAEAIQQLESLSHLRAGAETTRPVRAPLPRRSASSLPATVRAGQPFVGLRPLQAGEDALLLGRDKEWLLNDKESTLREDVHAFSKVVLWGDCGVGKTSLIQAGLLPTLRDVDRYHVLTVDSENPFESLAQQLLDCPHFLEPVRADNVLERVGYLAEISGQPLLVVFDHLERLDSATEPKRMTQFWEQFEAAVQALELAWPNAPWHILVSLDTPMYPKLREWIRHGDSPGSSPVKTRELRPWSLEEARHVVETTAERGSIPSPESFASGVMRGLRRVGPGVATSFLPAEIQVAGQRLASRRSDSKGQTSMASTPAPSLADALVGLLHEQVYPALSKSHRAVVLDMMASLVEAPSAIRIRSWLELRSSLTQCHSADAVDAVKKVLVQRGVLVSFESSGSERVSLAHTLWSQVALPERFEGASLAMQLHDAWASHKKQTLPWMPKPLARVVKSKWNAWEQLPSEERNPVKRWHKESEARRQTRALVISSSFVLALVSIFTAVWLLRPPTLESQVAQHVSTLLNDQSNEQSKFWLAVAALKKEPLKKPGTLALSKKLLASEGLQACRLVRALHHISGGRVALAVQRASGRAGAFLVNRLKCPASVSLQGIQLKGALLHKAELVQAKLNKAFLKGADLPGANLKGVNLEGADLRGANAKFATLFQANLNGTRLEGTNFQGSDLRGATFAGSSIHQAMLHGALFNSKQVPLLLKAKVNLQKALCLTGSLDKAIPSGVAGECHRWHRLGRTKNPPAHCPSQIRGPILLFPSLAKEGQCVGVLQQQMTMRSAFCPSPEHPACNDGRLCEKGKADACYRLGKRYEEGVKVKADLKVAAAMHRRACALNHQTSCFVLGAYSLSGRGMERNETQAAMYWAKVCNENHGDSCASLGTLYEKGWGVSRDLSKAKELYKRACEQSIPKGCTGLGLLYLTGQAVKGNKRLGLAQLRKACQRAYGPACYHLAMRYRSARRTRRKARRFLRKARALLDKTCQKDDAESCAMMGVLMEKGWGGRRDRERARELYNKACQQSHGMGCNALGQLFYTGTGVRRSFSTAFALYKKACKRNDAEGCDNLGSMYERARGVKRSYKQARLFYLKSCAMGYGWGCNDLGDIYNLGRGVRKNRRNARKWYRKACKLGVRSACR